MSNVGLNASIYHTTRNYMDLLNHFLVDVNYSHELNHHVEPEMVLTFLKTLLNKDLPDPTLKLVRSVFQSYYENHHRDIVPAINLITTKLENNQIDRDTVHELEDLIEVLKTECDESYARLKGK